MLNAMKAGGEVTGGGNSVWGIGVVTCLWLQAGRRGDGLMRPGICACVTAVRLAAKNTEEISMSLLLSAVASVGLFAQGAAPPLVPVQCIGCRRDMTEVEQTQIAGCAYRYLVQTGQILAPGRRPITYDMIREFLASMPGLLANNNGDLMQTCISLASMALETERAISHIGQ